MGRKAWQDLESAGISIYPVPASSHLNIKFGNLTEETQLEVVSASGSLISKTVVPANQNTYSLDLKGMENGLYYLHIRNSTLNNIGRFVITK